MKTGMSPAATKRYGSSLQRIVAWHSGFGKIRRPLKVRWIYLARTSEAAPDRAADPAGCDPHDRAVMQDDGNRYLPLFIRGRATSGKEGIGVYQRSSRRSVLAPKNARPCWLPGRQRQWRHRARAPFRRGVDGGWSLRWADEYATFRRILQSQPAIMAVSFCWGPFHSIHLLVELPIGRDQPVVEIRVDRPCSPWRCSVGFFRWRLLCCCFWPGRLARPMRGHCLDTGSGIFLSASSASCSPNSRQMAMNHQDAAGAGSSRTGRNPFIARVGGMTGAGFHWYQNNALPSNARRQ